MNRLRALACTLLMTFAAVGCDEGAETSDTQDVTSATGRFEIFAGEDGQSYFQLIAKNGERLLRSQGYASRSGAKSGIASVTKNGKLEARFELLVADNGEHYFNLRAGNGQVIATSELYTSEASAERGVDAVISALAAPSTADAETGTRFETFVGRDGKTYFRLRAQNGQIVLQSQGYSSKSGAQGGISSVKTHGVDATRFEIFEGADGQHTFRLTASNGKIIARGEMYASKSNALRGADRVRELLREMAGKGEPSDSELQAEIERAVEGLTYMSESDYPYAFVEAQLGDPEAPIDEATVRELFASVVEADPDADKPMAELVGEVRTWQDWKDAEHGCSDPEDPVMQELCVKTRGLESVLESNLSDVQVFYFGARGEPGSVDGVGVSIFIVGRTPAGTLAGVRTLAIWT